MPELPEPLELDGIVVTLDAINTQREEAGEHQLLALNRGHWSIENKLHLSRDTTYREDHSRICKHHGARSLATLKNLAIGLYALGVLDTRKSPCKTIPKMNRKLLRYPQIAINFFINLFGTGAYCIEPNDPVKATGNNIN